MAKKNTKKKKNLQKKSLFKKSTKGKKDVNAASLPSCDTKADILHPIQNTSDTDTCQGQFNSIVATKR